MGIVLLGYRGSGKTSVGRALAERLGMDFIDLDAEIVFHAKKTIREIFDSDGDAAFRDRETLTLLQVIGEDAILATGGGVVIRAENCNALMLSDHLRIYLRCDPAELHRRIHADPGTAANRPALTHLGGGIDEITSLLAEREPLYRRVMHVELDVTRASVDEVAAHIFDILTNADQN